MAVHRDSKVSFYSVVAQQAKASESLYVGNATDKSNLVDFMEMNGWFGVDVHICGEKQADTDRGDYYLDAMEAGRLTENICLWLDAYGRSDAEKLAVLAGYGAGKFPDTTSKYVSYIKESSLEEDANSWRLLDYLLSVLRKELLDADEDEMQSILDRVSREMPQVTTKLFISFWEKIQKETGKNGWTYRLHARSRRKENTAYPMRDFSRMAYCIFNEAYWEKRHLVEKACTSETNANLWAFLALHFVCGMRATDIERIPKPEIPCCGRDFRDRLLKKQINDAAMFSKNIQLRMKYKSRHPHKTSSYSGIPELKLFIPVSLEKPMGVILAVAASYHDDIEAGMPFIKAARNVAVIKKFLGEPFAEALGWNNFSSRRANKSYLQGIEAAAGMGGADAPKGYMIAALARSHKGGIGTLPDITEIYLKDAAFSGYTPEFIAKEMFERGVFGFIPHILLETYAGEAYGKLGIDRQTTLIQSIGISPSGIEGLAELAVKGYQMAKETVAELIADGTDMCLVLQRIASGAAPGKDAGSLCILAACGYLCRRNESRTCIGCRYEIYTKSVMHQMMKEYQRMKPLCSSEDGWRYRKMIREAVLPMAGELLHSVKKLYPDADMVLLAEIMERGIEGYGGYGKSGSRAGV